MHVGRLAVVVAAIAMVGTASPAAAVPPPCGGTPQMADASGDGHHDNTDIVAAWLSEQAGRLQVVIQLRQARWEPAHTEPNAVAGFAFLFDVGGRTGYVRAEAARQAPVRFDYGTWTRSGGFASAGATSGEAEAGAGGTATIDVPAQTGATPGAVLSRLFVMTSDGPPDDEPHWVDRAPGGKTPDDPAFGADFVVGSCPAAGAPPGGVRTTAVQLTVPRRLKGGGTARIFGRVAPARAGVPVELTATTTRRRSVVRRVVTRADGTFAVSLPVSETTRLRAVAEGIGSQTRTLTVASTVRIKVRRLRGGGAIVTGRVRPALPGRVLWLRSNAARPTATTRPRKGRFRLRLRRPRPGRYQAVFIPSGARAERSTSNTGVIR